MGQKRDAILAVFSVILLLLIAGCEGKKDTDTSKTAFMGGTQGLNIKFEEDFPGEVTDGGNFPFQARVRVKNEGEFDLKKEQVKVSLSGFNPTAFGATGNDITNKLPDNDPTKSERDDKGKVIQDPAEPFVTFPSNDGFFNYKGVVKGDVAEYDFMAEVCYKYQTKAVSKICVLKNMLVVDEDAICKPKEEKGVLSSGSPIQVTSFRQTVVSESRTQFNFDIAHMGRGKVFGRDDAIVDCPVASTEKRLQEDKVNVTINTGLSGLSCPTLAGKASGLVTLRNGKGSVTCYQDLAADRTNYPQDVDITLDFNYFDSTNFDSAKKENKKVYVRHLLGSVEGGTTTTTPAKKEGDSCSAINPCGKDSNGYDLSCCSKCYRCYYSGTGCPNENCCNANSQCSSGQCDMSTNKCTATTTPSSTFSWETPAGSSECSSVYYRTENDKSICANAKDGKTNTYWTTDCALPPQWIYFDLGTKKYIGGVKAVISTLSTPETMNIDISNDASSWTSAVSSWNVGVTTGWTTKTFSETSGRYIRLYITDFDRGQCPANKGYASISEFQAYTRS